MPHSRLDQAVPTFPSSSTSTSTTTIRLCRLRLPPLRVPLLSIALIEAEAAIQPVRHEGACSVYSTQQRGKGGDGWWGGETRHWCVCATALLPCRCHAAAVASLTLILLLIPHAADKERIKRTRHDQCERPHYDEGHKDNKGGGVDWLWQWGWRGGEGRGKV